MAALETSNLKLFYTFGSMFLFHICYNMFDCLFLVCLSRKEQIAEQREYKKKKAQKKVARMKELEQEREEQKSKWQQFNNKAYSKNKKGQVGFLFFGGFNSFRGSAGKPVVH